MSRLIVGALAAAAVFAGCGSKSDANEATSAQSEWKVDKAASRLEFSATQNGKEFSGTFSSFDAAIDFDPEKLAAARIEVIVDTASAKTGDRQRDAALPTADWFAVKAFPKAAFSASKVVETGAGAYEARGKLTIRDASRDLALPFTLKIDGDNAVADGSITLVRTDFGVGQGEFATGEWVGLDVKVSFHISASR